MVHVRIQDRRVRWREEGGWTDLRPRLATAGGDDPASKPTRVLARGVAGSGRARRVRRWLSRRRDVHGFLRRDHEDLLRHAGSLLALVGDEAHRLHEWRPLPVPG